MILTVNKKRKKYFFGLDDPDGFFFDPEQTFYTDISVKYNFSPTIKEQDCINQELENSFCDKDKNKLVALLDILNPEGVPWN